MKSFLIVIFILIFNYHSMAFAREDENLSREQIINSLDTIEKLFLEKYVFLKEKKEIFSFDFEKEIKILKNSYHDSSIEYSQTKFWRKTQRLLHGLKDGHVDATFSDYRISTLPIYIKKISNKFYVAHSSIPEKIAVGAEITKLCKRDIKLVYNHFLSLRPSYSVKAVSWEAERALTFRRGWKLEGPKEVIAKLRLKMAQ